MSTKRTNCRIDFYRQLSLLLKAGLPLPGSLRSLAPGIHSRSFRRNVEQLADSVESGALLSSAMRRYPGDFPGHHVDVIEGGERSGTLAAVLHELSTAARADYQIASLCRDNLFYPMIVLFFLLGLVILLCVTTFYPLMGIYEDFIYEYSRMPAVFIVSNFVCQNLGAVIAGYLLLLGSCVWLLSGGGAANRLLLGVIRVIPGLSAVFREMNGARLCIFWSMMLRRNQPEKELFPTLALCTGDRRLKRELETAGREVAAGVPVADALESAKSVPAVIRLTFRHVPEERIPDELEQLSQMFLERASVLQRRNAEWWEVMLTLFLALMILLAVFFLFEPLKVFFPSEGPL